MDEKRMHSRVGTANLISYLVLDDVGSKLSQGLGSARNISQEGMLLQTAQMIDTERISILSNDTSDNLMEIEGKVIYCRQLPTGNFEAGIRFQGATEEKLLFVTNLIRVFHGRKKNCHQCDWNNMISRPS